MTLKTDITKEILKNAKNSLVDTFGNGIEDVRVEELWEDFEGLHLTFSFLSPRFRKNPETESKHLHYYDYERLYKEVLTNKKGDIKSIKMCKNA
jgi:hypothetical protein